MKVSAIAAVGRNYELGKNGDLIWSSKADLAHFKEETMGKVLVSGRKTYESMPALKGRTVICLSSRGTTLKQDADHWITAPTVDEIWNQIVKVAAGRDIVIVGGAEIYGIFASKVEELLLTRFDATDPEADTYFPVDSYKDVMSGEGELLLDKQGVTRYIKAKEDIPPYEIKGEMIVVTHGRRSSRRSAYVKRAIVGLSESIPTHTAKQVTLYLESGENIAIHLQTTEGMLEAFDRILHWLSYDDEEFMQPSLDLSDIGKLMCNTQQETH